MFVMIRTKIQIETKNLEEKNAKRHILLFLWARNQNGKQLNDFFRPQNKEIV